MPLARDNRKQASGEPAAAAAATTVSKSSRSRSKTDQLRCEFVVVPGRKPILSRVAVTDADVSMLCPLDDVSRIGRPAKPSRRSPLDPATLLPARHLVPEWGCDLQGNVTSMCLGVWFMPSPTSQARLLISKKLHC